MPIAGSWQPVVIAKLGLIPVSTADKIEVGLQIDSILPKVALNPYGGTEMIINGKNLPSVMDGEVTIAFDDGTVCDIETVSPQKVTCVTEEFTAGLKSAALIITVNGKVDSTHTVTISDGPALVTSMVPSSVSPVLKTIIKFTVAGFVDTIDPDDLLVSFVSTTNAMPIRIAKVMESGFDDVEKNIQYLKVKFAGSESGTYQVKIRSKTYGRFDTTRIILTTSGRVTDFNPKKGSVNGGTLITIYGINFSYDPLDNPVRIGYTDCMVETSSPTQITCRTMPSIDDSQDSTDDLIVFLKTYEEAKCDVKPCTFTWVKTDLSSIESYSVDFDSIRSDYVLTITGTNFGATIDNTEILIDGTE